MPPPPKNSLLHEIEHEKSVLAILRGEKIETGKEKEKGKGKRKKEIGKEEGGRRGRRKIDKEVRKGGDYEKRTVVQLRAECKKRGLTVSGRKKELILRLEKDDDL